MVAVSECSIVCSGNAGFTFSQTCFKNETGICALHAHIVKDAFFVPKETDKFYA